jgi:membrane protein
MIAFVKQKAVPLFQQAAREWGEDDCADMAAALAYYALFSLFPLLLVVLSILGFIVGPTSDVTAVILALAREGLPPDAYGVVEETLINLREERGTLGLIGFGTLLVTASGFFGALSRIMDRIWDADEGADEGAGIVTKALNTVKQKAFAFALVLGCVLLVLLSMIANLAIEVLFAATRDLNAITGLPEVADVWLLQLSQAAISFLVLAGVLALIYRVLPAASVSFRDVWVGALFTALVFLLLQRLVIGGIVNLGDRYAGYGVIGGVLLLLFWISLTTQLLLFGAELSHAYATLFGSLRAEERPEPPAQSEAPAAPPPTAGDHAGDRVAAAGVGVLVGALGTLLLSMAALVLGAARVLRTLRRS